MKSVQDIVKGLDKIVNKTQVIMDIRLGNHGLYAEKVGNTYMIEDDIAQAYIIKRKKLHAEKLLKKKKLVRA